MRAAHRIAVAPERRDNTARSALLQRVSGEFLEMPCLQLTMAQAQRLFGLPADVCQRVLKGLVREGTLVCDATQRYRLNDARIWSDRPLYPSRVVTFRRVF